MRVVQLSAIDMTQVKLLKKLNVSSKNQGFQVHCISSHGEYVNEILQDGLNFHAVDIKREIAPISNLKSIYKLYKTFKKLQPDIVHVHTPIASVLGRIAAKLAGVPNIIYTAHGFYFHEGMSKKTYSLFFNIEKVIGRYFTDYMFFQSEEDYRLAIEHNFLKKDNYLLISNGIDLDNKFNYNRVDKNSTELLKKEHNINKEDIVITFIGRLVKEKGIFDLLDAFNLIKSQNVKLIIMGSLPSSERDMLSYSEIMKYQSNPNIIFTGQVNNTEEYLYISDIFCLPSYREGMPRSIIEAMSMKNAIIATNIRGSREEVIHGRNGYLVNLNSSREIADRIDELVSDRNTLYKMKQESFDRAHMLYNEEEVVRKQLEVFERLRKKVR
ncbi:glycosyltransferase family 4 protein [Phocicoccus pinnipedialis]|uniref:Glycosyltransferase EpsD n=1 Tax=Phocicoccus pinnipedialis TaxID=110845 RepID=A0A6V7RLP5_9BACL|nr:glycosyltransferase family 4 protein [Jeotgalicoccus pinnipedialis]MBP1938813.1 glycosyltransferase involved in cell wall biosynthesis [Jeotgalicoccus pinnipedialis]CAD2079259.1 Putative glycosyltransferase EpsD [Jeotgalicoccus pinnipedialis]